MKNQLFFLKRYLQSRNEVSFYNKMVQNETNLTYDELAELNWIKRKLLVNYTFENNKFYRQKYLESGYSLGDLKDEKDFQLLPILEKSEIRIHINDMISYGVNDSDLNVTTTGGSTGQPLKIFRPKNDMLAPISWRGLGWWNVRASDNGGYLYRAVPSALNQKIQKALLWPTKRQWISALEMSEQNMMSFYLKLKADRVRYLVGYVGAIEVFADFIEDNKFKLEELVAIWTTAAPLPEVKRSRLERIFNTKVYTQYGSCEFYWLASECQHKTGLHIASDVRHVEVVNENVVSPVNEFGDIVATDLTNFDFPLIRYRLGDRGRLLDKHCQCGRPFPLMDYVKGRTSDSIYLKSGHNIPGEFWTTIFDDYPDSVKSFQIHQKKNHSIIVRYMTPSGCDLDKTIVDRITYNIQSKAKDDLCITFLNTNVEHIAGKLQFVTSEIKK